MRSKCFQIQRCKHLIGREVVERPSWSCTGAFYRELSLLPIFLSEAHFLFLLLTLKSLHSSLILHWQPFVFNQRKTLKQCSIELSTHDTVYLCPCHQGLWLGCEDDISLPIPLYFYSELDYDKLRRQHQINADTTLSIVSPAHLLSRVASSIQNRFFVTHG